MTYKEKLAEAKRLYKIANADQRYILESLFPELKEGKDERIRKWLIGYFQQYRTDGMEVVYTSGFKVDDIIDWLELQAKNVQPDIPEDGQILNSLAGMDKRVFLDRPVTLRAVIDWLERQCETKTDCPQNHQDVNHPNGCIVFADFNGGEGYYKLHLDYLNQKQVEEIERMIRIWNNKNKPEDKGENLR